MKILHINTTSSRGGAAQMATHLHHCLRDAGYNSRLLVARDPSDFGKGIFSLNESRSRFLLNVLSYRFLGREGFLNEGLWRKSLEEMQDFDVVHIHNAHGYYMPKAVLSYLLSKPVVWTLHDFWLATGGLASPEFEGLWRKGYPLEWIDRSKIRRQFLADLVSRLNPVLVAPTFSSALKLKEHGLISSNLHIVPHGIFESVHVATGIDRVGLRDKFRWQQDAHVFVFAASSVDNKLKGFEVFLSGLLKLPKHRKWVAYVVGGMAEESKRMVKQSGVLGVEFVGALGNRQLREYFRSCDTYVTATYSESYGLTVVEALGEGASVVCSDLSVLREVTDGYAQYFSVGDSDALANCLLNDLNKSKESKRDSWSDKIRGRYSNSNMVSSYARLYSLAIDQYSMS